MSATARGWAVEVGGVIDVATVSPTRRAALINWLHTKREPVLNIHGDDDIERMWVRRGAGARVCEVLIEEVQ